MQHTPRPPPPPPPCFFLLGYTPTDTPRRHPPLWQSGFAPCPPYGLMSLYTPLGAGVVTRENFRCPEHARNTINSSISRTVYDEIRKLSKKDKRLPPNFCECFVFFFGPSTILTSCFESGLFFSSYFWPTSDPCEIKTIPHGYFLLCHLSYELRVLSYRLIHDLTWILYAMVSCFTSS